jgi:hypothetical protein
VAGAPFTLIQSREFIRVIRGTYRIFWRLVDEMLCGESDV